ncbi:MAG: ATP-grasp domain-containing protein [Lachnospiraceae bacterium]|nr:ATP-grasp domain-containing protein [Lachnospiraceae bacterium]
MTKKRILITGGSHSELPLIEAAQGMGWHVITTGIDTGGIGHAKADEYVKGDFSDKEFVLQLAKEKHVDAIVSGCNDFAYLSTAYACEQLGMPGHDNYEVSKLIHMKHNFRSLSKKLKLPTPEIYQCYNQEDVKKGIRFIGFPLLVKPVDLTGGKGVKVCHNEMETMEAYENAMAQTRQPYVILEQYVEGSNHGISVLLKNKKVVCHVVDNEQYGHNKYLVLGASSPSDIPQHAIFALIRDIEALASYLNLTDGLFHTQFIVNEEQLPVMIDPCRRSPGDLYVLLAKYVTGVDYPLEIVKAECGMPLADSYSSECHFVARECIMTDRCGKIERIEIAEEIRKYLIYSIMLSKKGTCITQPMKQKAGILIMEFENYMQMHDILRRYHELVWLELAKEDNCCE